MRVTREVVRVIVTCVLIVSLAPSAAQDTSLVRNGAFEVDEDGDGLPDEWFNGRGASLVARGDRGRCLQLSNDKLGLPAHLMQAFSLGKEPPAWLAFECELRLQGVQRGRNSNETAAAVIHFFDENYEAAGNREVGPWVGDQNWIRLSAPIRVPPGARDAVLRLGMFGATGQLQMDNVRLSSFTPVDDNLLLNGDFRFGDVRPLSWAGEGQWSRTRVDGEVCLHVPPGSSAVQAVYVGHNRPNRLLLDFHLQSATGRAAVGQASVSFLPDDAGQGAATELPAGEDWSRGTLDADVPDGAGLAVVRIGAAAGGAAIQLREVRLRAFDADGKAVSSDFEHRQGGANWWPYEASDRVEPGSPLDASHLLHAPAGKHGFVAITDGRFAFDDGTPARFYGVEVRPPHAFPDDETATAFAERLAAAGINLVRFAGLDDPEAWRRNLLNPDHETSQQLSTLGLAALDRLCAELKARGVYYAFELCSERTLRQGDGIEYWRSAFPGLLLVSFLDSRVQKLQTDFSTALIAHRNPHTDLEYRQDPALAFVNLAARGSLVGLPALSGREPLAETLATSLDARWNQWLAAKHQSRAGLATAWKQDDETELLDGEDPTRGSVRRALKQPDADTPRARDLRAFYRELMTETFVGQAQALKDAGLRVPIAATAAPTWLLSDLQARAALDFVLTSARWSPTTPVVSPHQHAAARDAEGHPFAQLAAGSVLGKPVVALAPREAGNDWCNPHQWVEPLPLAAVACLQDWDALLCGEVSPAPRAWAHHIPGSLPQDGTSVRPNLINAHPSALAQLPVAARLFLGEGLPPSQQSVVVKATPKRLDSAKLLRDHVPAWLPFSAKVRVGLQPAATDAAAMRVTTAEAAPPSVEWNSDAGRYVIRSRRLEGVAGFVGGQRLESDSLTVDMATECCGVYVASLTDEPLSTSPRLLVTAVSFATQTGMTYTDGRLLGVVDLGKPPMLLAPVLGTVAVKQKVDGGTWTAYRLDASGHRAGQVGLDAIAQSLTLSLGPELKAQHIELVRE